MTTRCLVTGGAGFIGSHLVEHLRRDGQRVRVLDLKPPHGPENGIEYVRGSVTDLATVRRAMCGVEQVFHLAAIANLWTVDKRDYYRVNHLGTCNVIQAARSVGASVVHCSTEAVLKHRKRNPPFSSPEEIRLSANDMAGPYCRSKLLAEREALAAADHGMAVVVVNPTVPVGPGDRFLTSPARMLLGFLNGEHPAYLETVINLVDVRDVAEGHVRAAERGRSGQRYLLGGEDLELGRLLERLQQITGLPMPHRRVPYRLALAFSAFSEVVADYVTRRPPKAPLTGVRLAGNPLRFDNSKAREELGLRFRPVTESLIDAIADFRQRGLLPPHIRGAGGDSRTAG